MCKPYRRYFFRLRTPLPAGLARVRGLLAAQPLGVCEVTPSAALVACELFGTWVGNVGEVLNTIGVPVLFAVTLAQEVSYCEVAPTLLFACALLYATPPLPPFMLTVPGSLCVEPGDVTELPGPSWAGFALGPLGGPPNPHMLPWPTGLAYAGAAPRTATATMQLAENSLCLIFSLRLGARRGAHPTGYTMSTGIRFNDVRRAS